MSWYMVYFLFTFIVTLMFAHVSNLGKGEEGKKNEKKSINSLIVKIDIDKFDSQNFINSLGIARIVVVDEDGKIEYRNQRLYSVAEIYNDKLIDLLGVFDKSLKDVIISGIRE